MATEIHPTAVVDPAAALGERVTVGPYAVIGAGVELGDECEIGAHAVIQGPTRVGARNRIFPHAAVGFEPQDLKYRGEASTLELGDDNQIREFSTLHRGTEGGGGVTRVGSHNLFMAYAHVAHDCLVGSHNVFANGATLAGHVIVGDHVILGGLSAIHQFCRVGDHAFVAGGTIAVLDIAPYCTVQGDRASLAGLNTVGLKRRGFSDEQIGRVKRLYRVIFRSKLPLDQAKAQALEELGGHPEIDAFLAFLDAADRGLTR